MHGRSAVGMYGLLPSIWVLRRPAAIITLEIAATTIVGMHGRPSEVVLVVVVAVS